MKKFTVNINSKLKNIEITVRNGRKFSEAAIQGTYTVFDVEVSDNDIKRIKEYAVKNGNDNNSNNGKWYAHCIDYSMGLFVAYDGRVHINTYADYRHNKRLVS